MLTILVANCFVFLVDFFAFIVFDDSNFLVFQLIEEEEKNN